eukprot:TRINITY_DN1906_c0_g1_i1.p1 TRINITY_DN1906_c0_g1~~TRINITY_DN1906_c0_g1_i1.p1  ORF type:complete len:539 (-),score=64.02 TRINITY_DN1906_c0_g1_i1:291-1907(-)
MRFHVVKRALFLSAAAVAMVLTEEVVSENSVIVRDSSRELAAVYPFSFKRRSYESIKEAKEKEAEAAAEAASARGTVVEEIVDETVIDVADIDVSTSSPLPTLSANSDDAVVDDELFFTDGLPMDQFSPPSSSPSGLDPIFEGLEIKTAMAEGGTKYEKKPLTHGSMAAGKWRYQNCGNRGQAKPLLPGNGVYLGAVLEGQLNMAEFNAHTGIAHASFTAFFRFPEVSEQGGMEELKLIRFMEEVKANCAIAIVTVETFGGLYSYTKDQIWKFGTLLNRWKDVQIIIRWNHEMNGSWYPWGQQPWAYKEKFREFGWSLRTQCPHIAMAWTPNQQWGFPWPNGKYHRRDANAGGPFMQYYPGDDIVDWVGMSVYHFGYVGAVPGHNMYPEEYFFQRAIKPFYDDVVKKINKPMLIAETSALFKYGGGGVSECEVKGSWIRQVYGLDRSHSKTLQHDFPLVKLITWFNLVKHEESFGHVTWRVDENPSVIAEYRSIVRNDYYLKASHHRKSPEFIDYQRRMQGKKASPYKDIKQVCNVGK